MAMRFEVHSAAGAAVLMPIGRLEGGTAAAADSAVLEVVLGGGRALVLDFAHVDYVSCAGLRVILTAHKRLRAVGGRMAVCNISDPVRAVFASGGFLDRLVVARSRDEAVLIVRSEGLSGARAGCKTKFSGAGGASMLG